MIQSKQNGSVVKSISVVNFISLCGFQVVLTKYEHCTQEQFSLHWSQMGCALLTSSILICSFLV